MVATVEHRYGQVNRVPEPIKRLTDNASCYTARDTRAFARGIGLIPPKTPVSSPQSNGMVEAFVRTVKRDYVRVNPRPDAQSVMTDCSAGSLLITRCIRTALCSIDHPASSSCKPARLRQAFKATTCSLPKQTRERGRTIASSPFVAHLRVVCYGRLLTARFSTRKRPSQKGPRSKVEGAQLSQAWWRGAFSISGRALGPTDYHKLQALLQPTLVVT